MRIVARVIAAARYVGTPESAADVLDAIQQTVTSSSVWSMGSYDSDSVTIHEVGEYGEADWSLSAGRWMVISSNGPFDFLDDDDFGRQYRTMPEQVG